MYNIGMEFFYPFLYYFSNFVPNELFDSIVPQFAENSTAAKLNAFIVFAKITFSFLIY